MKYDGPLANVGSDCDLRHYRMAYVLIIGVLITGMVPTRGLEAGGLTLVPPLLA